jgi:hypothetical protein
MLKLVVKVTTVLLAIVLAAVIFFSSPATAASMSIPTDQTATPLRNPEGVLQIAETQFFADCSRITPLLLKGDVRACMDQISKLVDKGYGPLRSLVPVMDNGRLDKVAGFMLNLQSPPVTEEVATVTYQNGKAIFGSYHQVVPALPAIKK